MMNRPQPRYKKGQLIGGRYLVHRALMGGMGEVYLCHFVEADTFFALKTFQRSMGRELQQLFQIEARNWTALEKHENVVRCFYTDLLDDQPYLVLEWVSGDKNHQGIDLREWLKHGPLDLRQALDFTIDICRGLRHTQTKLPGFVHRDLKPENILVNRDRIAKITDFGLATIVASEKNDIAGTPHYMAPEQWLGEKLDITTDVYAVGCILYEMVTGRSMYDASTQAALRELHLQAPIPAIKEGRDLQSELNEIIGLCVAKKRADRIQAVDELLNKLESLYAEAFGETPREEKSPGEFNAFDYAHRGIAYNNLGEPERAIQDFNRAIELEPDHAQTYANRGTSFARLGDHQRAIDDYNQAIEIKSDIGTFYSNRGFSFARLGDNERAILDYSRAIEIDESGSSIYYVNRGASLVELGRVQEAIYDFEVAIKLAPNNANGYYNRGCIHASLDDHLSAIRDFDQAIKCNPYFLAAYSTRADSWTAVGEYRRAIQDCDFAVQLEPNHREAYINRADAYTKLGSHEEALRDLDNAMQLGIDQAVYSSRALVHTALGNYLQAFNDHNKAIELAPQDAQTYVNRGFTFAEMGDHQRAIQDFDRAIKLGPTASAYHNRATSYSHLGNPIQALSDYDDALNLNPKNSKTLLGKGTLLWLLGRFQEAIHYGELAESLGLRLASEFIADVKEDFKAKVNAQVTTMQVVVEAFKRTSSLSEMRQTFRNLPMLADPDFIQAVEHVIKHEISAEQIAYFEQRLAWLRQVLFESTQETSTEDIQIRFTRQLMRIYEQYGEAGLHQYLRQNNVPVNEIDKLVANIIQISKRSSR